MLALVCIYKTEALRVYFGTSLCGVGMIPVNEFTYKVVHWQMCKRQCEIQSHHAKPCLISPCDREEKENKYTSSLRLFFLTTHQFSVGDRQDGEGLIKPWGAA